jgi:uncharacterized protein involved in exopolysaccharide biosynthesis
MKQNQEALQDFKIKQRERLLAELSEQKRIEREGSLTTLKSELSLLETRRNLLLDKFKKEMEGVKGENAKTIELEFAHAELLREESVFEMIAARKLAMQTESRAPARVALRQKASPPLNPLSPLPYKVLLLACSGALVAPFGLAVVRETSSSYLVKRR